MNKLNLEEFDCEDNTFSRRMQGKRLLADYETCKIELKNVNPLLFKTYMDAIEKTNEALFLFPPHSRSRNLEASIIQSCFAESLITNFSGDAFFGKYRRLILRVNGYLILFKKLNSKGYPMNIKTINVQSILNQSQVLDLFADTDYNDEPILYFGYQKNRFGEFVNPQLIYIDEGDIKFSIAEADMQVQSSIQNIVPMNGITEVKPKLKDNQELKKAN